LLVVVVEEVLLLVEAEQEDIGKPLYLISVFRHQQITQLL
jgi:hypothetical protein